MADISANIIKPKPILFPNVNFIPLAAAFVAQASRLN
jgi:hypothetical protein